MRPADLARSTNSIDSWQNQYRSAGYATGSSAATVIADTGQLPTGWYDIYAFCAASAALAMNDIVFQWQNAANNAALWGQIVTAAGAGFNSIYLKTLYVVANERFRWYTVNGYAGTLNCSIIAIRRV